MVLLESEMVPLGSKAHNFSLRGIDNKIYSLKDFDNKKILIIVFMCNHCPYVKASLDRLIEIQRTYQKKGVQIVGMNSNEDENYPEDSFENMIRFAKEKEINFPYLRDETQEVAKSYEAVCTPDIFVYDSSRKLVYRGRIDDNWQHPDEVTRHDLRRALEAIIKGKNPDENQHPSMGCSIKWKE